MDTPSIEGGLLLISREIWFTLILTTHILCGSIALSTFWVPLVAAKGGRIHIFFGRTYLLAMIATLVTAVILCYLNLTRVEILQERYNMSLFLLYISLLTFATGWYGWRVLHFKNREAVHDRYIDLAIPTALLVASIATMVTGAILNKMLFILFPIIGILIATGQLRYWLSVPATTMSWWFEHMQGMFGAVIATLTAFCIVVMPRFTGLPANSLLLWFGPTAIFVPILLVWQRYYRSRI